MKRERKSTEVSENRFSPIDSVFCHLMSAYRLESITKISQSRKSIQESEKKLRAERVEQCLRPKRQGSQLATGSYLRLSPKWWFCLQEPQHETVWGELFPPNLYSSLGLGWKEYTTLFYGNYCGYWIKVVCHSVTGIKGVCYHNLVWKSNQWDHFTLRRDREGYYIVIKKSPRWHFKP